MELTVEELQRRMQNILHKWHRGTRPGNDGEAGNTLEDLLEIAENNFSLPDFGKIEIKTKKTEGGSLLTLLHKEPKPARSIPKLLLSMGWRHQEAGIKYPLDEKSFRSTTYGHYFSVRGFRVVTDEEKISFEYDPSKVNRLIGDKTEGYPTYGHWADDIELRSKPNYKDVFPLYYNLDEVIKKLKEKLDHTMLATRKTTIINGGTHYMYDEIFIMQALKGEMIPILIQEGSLAIDFDARTHHNHGTKIRIKKSELPRLFTNYKEFG